MIRTYGQAYLVSGKCIHGPKDVKKNVKEITTLQGKLCSYSIYYGMKMR